MHSIAPAPDGACLPEPGPLVIVGAGQAAAALVRQLRESGGTQDIVLFGDEPHPPYERPPLSKAVLDEGHTTLPWLLSAADMERLRVAHRAGVRVTRIDCERREVHTDSGERQAYGTLVLATGGRARPLDGLDMADETVHTLRTLEDALALHRAWQAGQRLVVIGGGWIGLEVAAVAQGKGLAVTVLEAAARVCERSLPAEASDFLQALHRARGVDIRLQARVQGLQRLAGGAWRIDLGEGAALQADRIVVGVGLVPNAELAAEAGLALAHGAVRVDADGRTSDPHVFAAGDVACFHSRWGDRLVRLESWANAQAQGAAVARVIAGAAVPPGGHEVLPTFWSEQHGITIQMAGLPTPAAQVVARSAQPDKPVWLQCENDRVTGVVAVGVPREFRAARLLIERGTPVTAAQLADPATRLDRL